MDAAPSLHPTDQTLSSYGLGKLDDHAAEAVNEHLIECSDCRKRVAEMSADSFLLRVRDAQKPSGKSTSGQPQAGGTQSDKVVNTLTSSSADSLPPGLAAHPDYEIKRELGRGGMGVVYLAHNTLMGRDDVLKVMGQHLMEHPGVLERFLREIRSVAKLRHANIVTAYLGIRRHREPTPFETHEGLIDPGGRGLGHLLILRVERSSKRPAAVAEPDRVDAGCLVVTQGGHRGYSREGSWVALREL